jgi:RiboL-PSP-HEPN
VINVLNQFKSRVLQLNSFLDDANSLNFISPDEVKDLVIKLGENNVLEHLSRLSLNSVGRRVQTYASGIILLYGLFEQYIENLVESYIDEIDSLTASFNDLPEKIIKNHLTLSAQLLVNKELDKYKDRINESDVINRMNSCLSDKDFKLNSLAYIDHKSNFRTEQLNQFFEAVGISGICARIRKSNIFKNYITEKTSLPQNIDNLSDKIIFQELDDLIWRRNQIAHSWPEDTISIDEMKEKANFIQIIGESIYFVLRQSILPYVIKNSIALPKPIVVHGDSIVCFHLAVGTLRKGNKIAAVNSKGLYYEGEIVSMEIDGVRHDEINISSPTDLGICLNFKCKQNYKYFLLLS